MNVNRTIWLDAGHFVKDPGACSKYGIERDCMMRIRDLLAHKLVNKGFTVLCVPDDRSLLSSIEWINMTAKGLQSGYALALHLNANTGVPGVGAEGWYAGGVEGSEVVTQARMMMQNILDEYCVVTGYKNRGVLSDERNPIHHRLGFVRDTKCFAGLIELGFINNQEEMDHFNKNNEQIAQALYQGILKAYGISFLETNEEDMKVDSIRLLNIYDELLFGRPDLGADGYLGMDESEVRRLIMVSPERNKLKTAIQGIRETAMRASGL